MKTTAHWREAGKWWDGEQATEWLQYVDNSGAFREKSIPLSQRKRKAVLPEQPVVKEARTVDYDVLKLEERRVRQNAVYQVSMTNVAQSIPFAPLHCISAYSFGQSSLTPEQIALLARSYGMKAAAITDYFSLSSAVDFCRTAAALDIKPILGATLEVDVGGRLVLLAQTEKGYRNLSRLITHCHLSQPRLFPLWMLHDTPCDLSGIVCLTGGHSGPINRMLSQKDKKSAESFLRSLLALFEDRSVLIEIERSFAPWETSVNKALCDLSRRFSLKRVAGGAITHGEREDFFAQDALACVESLCTVDDIIVR
jgi:DNA polymerase III alpha subunit